MNQLLTALVCPPVLAVAMYTALFAPIERSFAGEPPATVAAGVPEAPRGAAVFEMKYRGLDTPDDPMSCHSYCSFGTPGGEQGGPFVAAVKSKIKDCSLVFGGALSKAPWSVVELDENKEPVAFYFDLNGDGRLSDNEKFPRAAASKLGFPCVFITSDFQMPTRDGQEVPFRVMLVANRNGVDYSYMWSPHCVLEGQATLAGTPMKLILTTNGFDGSFATFGRGSFSLLPAEQKIEENVPRSTLSSVINHQGTFYRLRLPGTHAQGSLLRVVLEKDTTPTGRATVTVAGKEGLKTRLKLQGAKDDTIQFYVSESEPTLPVGQYKVPYGYLNYGSANTDEWNVNFNDGPQLDITAAQTARLDLGQPVLSIRAIEEKDRKMSDAKARSTYAKGTPIYLAPQIKGKAGEVYTRFSQKNKQNDFVDVNARVAIVDSNGKAVASADMPYT